MTLSSTVELFVNGAKRSIATEVALDDLDRNGVAWCLPARQLPWPPNDPAQALGVYLNLAAVARAQGRPLDELGALRAARRLGLGAAAELGALIERTAPLAAFEPGEGAQGLTIVSQAADPVTFRAVLGDVALPCENLYYARAPYREASAAGADAPVQPFEPLDDVTFHVCRGAKRLATVPLVVRADGVACWTPLVSNYGPVPARIHLAPDGDAQRRTLGLVLAYLDHLMRAYAVKEAMLAEPLAEEMALYKLLGREHAFSAELWDRPVIDLEPSEERLQSGVRASYKSTINWCRANLTVEYASGAELDEARTAQVHAVIQRCHQRVIERRGDNMTPDSFRLALALCRAGRGEVAVARDANGEPCAIAVTIDEEPDAAYYALGGQIALGNRHPGNFIIFDALLRAKRRGRRRFHPNTLSPAPVYRQLTAIQVRAHWQISNFFFKRGFSNDLELAHVYRILPTSITALGPR